MAAHNDTGHTGEALAAEWLRNCGYNILHLNWRHRHWEVDVIATRNGILHFIEVKTRRSLRFGYPEDNVSSRKILYLTEAAEEYLYLNPQWNRIQFDVLAISLFEKSTEYFFIEDVYL